MENFITEWEVKNLVRELSEGREQARQLQMHLSAQSSSSYETREFLLHRIMSSYDHALSMLHHPPPAAAADSPGGSLPPAGSPHSDDSDPDVKDQASRKRKGVPRWTCKVRVCPETGIEGQLDDGYGWRKYGQKDILGAKHPRGYYRCTNRHGQGCLATKQVQRSDEDPTVFVITYRREHTCNPRGNPPDPNPLPENPGSQTQHSQGPVFNIQTSLKLLNQEISTDENPFNFPSSSPPINNPQTSQDSDSIFGRLFPLSDSALDSNFGGLIPNMMHNTSESELSPIVAAMTSGTNTPAPGTNLPAGPSGLDSNFSFGNQGYYP